MVAQLQNLYAQARAFLIREMAVPNAESILLGYLDRPDRGPGPRTLRDVYRGLLDSAQNANMKRGVVSGSIDGIDALGAVLFAFDPHKTRSVYGLDDVALLDAIERTLKPRSRNGIRRTARSIWPHFCRAALSGAAFLSQFESVDDFLSWARQFYGDPRSAAALPLLLSEEIHGFGYPLACDFLKELGFMNYGKPDVHLIDILTGVGVCPQRASAYQVQKTIVEIAKANQVTPYHVDKLFWLIGSGRFDRHPELGTLGSIGRKKRKFIEAFGHIVTS